MPVSTPQILPTHLSEQVQARFWAKVALPNEQGCMLWLAYVDPHGYGRFGLCGKVVKAYQVSYVLAHGPIPPGMHIDHVRAKGCTNKSCVAPDHLEAVTPRENVLRGRGFAARNVLKTHCPQGHAYDEANTYVDTKGRRYCRTCRQARDRNRGTPTAKLFPAPPDPLTPSEEPWKQR